MPNKIFGDVVKGYLVEGAGKKGYLKCSDRGYGDGKTSSPVGNYNTGAGNDGSIDSWFEGKNGGVGYTK